MRYNAADYDAAIAAAETARPDPASADAAALVAGLCRARPGQLEVRVVDPDEEARKQMMREYGVQTFPDGRKLVTLHHPIGTGGSHARHPAANLSHSRGAGSRRWPRPRKC